MRDLTGLDYRIAARDADQASIVADNMTRLNPHHPGLARLHRLAADEHLAALAVSPVPWDVSPAEDAIHASHREAVLRHWSDANHLAAKRAALQTSIRLSGESFLRYLGIVPATQATEGQA